jgi:CBS domain-containing protein
MLVREVMSSPVITLRPADSVRHAIRVLHTHDITAAPVLDEDGGLAGIVSEMDLLRGEFEPDPRAHVRPVAGPADPPPCRVAEVMTPDPVTVTEITDVTSALDLMVGKRIKSLPVTRGDEVTGMLSRRDLLAMLARPDDDLRAGIVTALAEQYPFGPRWEVEVHDGVAELRGGSSGHADTIACLIAHTVPGVVRVRHIP